MPSVRVTLLDEAEALVGEVTVEADTPYRVNDHFRSPTGGVYLVCAVEEGAPPVEQELTAVWIDGPHPRPHL